MSKAEITVFFKGFGKYALKMTKTVKKQDFSIYLFLICVKILKKDIKNKKTVFFMKKDKKRKETG